MAPRVVSLDELEMQRGVRLLARREPRFAAVHKQYGYPPLWARAPGFPTLIHIILAQQVSLAWAWAAFTRLKSACRGRVTPRRLLAFSDAQMLEIGFSRQKARYARELSRAVMSGQFDPAELANLPDGEVRT